MMKKVVRQADRQALVYNLYLIVKKDSRIAAQGSDSSAVLFVFSF